MAAERPPVVLVAAADALDPAWGPAADPRMVARVLLCRVAGVALNRDPADVRLGHDAAGRPLVTGPGADGLVCSVSHAGRAAVAAVAIGCRVGVDVEPVDPRRADLATVARYVDAAEAARLATLAAEERPGAVALAWTRLEAEAKGRGMALDRLRGRPRTGSPVALDVPPGHVGTAWTDRPAAVMTVDAGPVRAAQAGIAVRAASARRSASRNQIQYRTVAIE